MTNSNPGSPVVPDQAAPSQDARTPNFLRDIIAEDVRTKNYGDAQVLTHRYRRLPFDHFYARHLFAKVLHWLACF